VLAGRDVALGFHERGRGHHQPGEREGEGGERVGMSSSAWEHIGNNEEPTVSQKTNSKLCLYFALMQILVIVR
jgi:hypothetical protein